MEPNRTDIGTVLSTAIGIDQRHSPVMRESDRPAIWRRLCDLTGLEPSVSVDRLHAAIPAVGRGTIQRIGEGNAPRYDSLQRIADYLGVTVPDILSDSPTRNQRISTSGVSHAMRHLPRETPPTIKWESLLTEELPPVFGVAAPDDSMFPRIAVGEMVYFSSIRQAVPGDEVLLCDSAGNAYIRVYRQRTPTVWTAQAENPDHLPLESDRDGLTVLGVMIEHVRRRRT